LLKLQVLLDRSNISPGEIDGQHNARLEEMIAAFAEVSGVSSTPWLAKFWLELALSSAEPALREYTITRDDLKGPFLRALPSKMEDMSTLEMVSYTSLPEALAERFHMSELLLKALNPNSSFRFSGEKIIVANVRSTKRQKAARLEVEIERRTIKAFDDKGRLIAFFPASVGSSDKPSPSGILSIVSIVSDPTFHYNPKYKFKEVDRTSSFEINAGPNNPLGTMWIGLSKPSYGIHGTPDPSGVGKSSSHGCVRMTNWDVQRLSEMVTKGTSVRLIANQTLSSAAPH
jgi:lipoprotein-anchoring transpeptidase ErfK/SrfK